MRVPRGSSDFNILAQPTATGCKPSETPFLVTCVAGWMNQHQRDIINYLLAENRVL
jgi:hypothetical protein